MKKYTFLISLFLASFFEQGFAQLKIHAHDDCATKPGVYQEVDKTMATQARLSYTTPYIMKVFLHICADDNGANLAVNNAAAFNTYIQGTRNFYSGYNICFLLMGIDTIKSTTINYMLVDNNTDYNTLVGKLVPGNMNIFFHTSLADAGGNYNGNAYAIPNNFCSILGSLIGSSNTSTMTHEMGHDFGLYHTFETQFGAENVPRNGGQSNCTTAGDKLCGTTADYNPTGSFITGACVYTGTATDANGVTYAPPIRNLMTYGRFECRNLFTTDQRDRMHDFITTNALLTPTIAPDNLTYSSNATLSSGISTLGARTNVTFNPTSYTASGSGKLYLSAGNAITISPGSVFQPGSNGLTDIHINTLCQ